MMTPIRRSPSPTPSALARTTPTGPAGATTAVARTPSGTFPATTLPIATLAGARELSAPVRAQHVAVSGIGVAGLMAAYSSLNRAADIGLRKLTLLDVRDHNYVLETGFNFRPEHLRMMAVMSPKAARKLFDASGLVPGNEANVLRTWDGDKKTARIHLSAELSELCRLCESGELSAADREAILSRGKRAPSMAHYAHEVADQHNACVVTAKELERIYFDGLSEAAERAGVELDYRPFSTIAVVDGAAGQKSYVTQAFLGADGKPTRNAATPDAKKVAQPLADLDLLFVAEGAGGARAGTRAAVGETGSRAITPEDQQWMAGLIKDPSATHGLGRYHAVELPDGTKVRAVRADHAVNGNQWRLVQVPKTESTTPVLVADIPAADVARIRGALTAAGKPSADLDVEKTYHGERLERLFRKLTATVGEVDADAACHNAFGAKGAPAPFTIAGRAYEKAVLAGGPSNAANGLPLTVALGDAVLNSSFNVSLGAGTSLLEYVALDGFWDAVARKTPRGEAASALETSLLGAAHTWGVSAITQFDGRPRDLVATYYPKNEMEKVFPAEVVARYYRPDGTVRTDAENKFWRGWLVEEAEPALSEAAVAGVIKGAQRSPAARGPRDLGPVPARA